MKKLFFFAATLLASASLMATQTVLVAGENKIETALSTALAGDTIVLNETDTFHEWHALTFDKKIILMAGADKKPILAMNKFLITADFEINGVEVVNKGTDYVFRINANMAEGVVAIKNCYLHKSSTPFVYSGSTVTQIGTITIDNCIFDDNSRNEGGLASLTGGTVSNFTLTNSTVSNFSGKYAVRVGKPGNVLVDQCTFYNNGERAILIGEYAETGCPNVVVKNTIVYGTDPAVAGYAIATYGGEVKNCMYYKTAKGPREGSDATAVSVTDCSNADPLFMDAAKGDFKLKKTSPAINFGTDGKTIGDPRWGVEGPGTGIIEAAAVKTAKKMMIDGKMMIMRDGKAYNVLGF